MSQEPVPMFAEADLRFARSDVHAGASKTQGPSRIKQPSPLARQLATPGVQIVDQVAILAAFILTCCETPARQGLALTTYLALRISVRNMLTGVILLLLWRSLFWFMGMYQPHINRRALTFFWKVPCVALLCTAVVSPVYLRLSYGPHLQSIAVFWFTATIFLLVLRAAVFSYEETVRPLFRPLRTAIICGTGPLARSQAMDLPTSRQYRYQLLGFVDSNPHESASTLGPLLCGVEDLEQLLMHRPVDEVIIGLPLKSRFGEVEQIVSICGHAGVQIQYSLDLFSTDVAKKRVVSNHSHRVVMEMVHSDHRVLIKDVIDRALAFFGLMLLWPLFACIAVAIKISAPGPVFFVQQRFGLNKRRFGMIKFRSMVVDAEARQAALEHLNETSGPTFKMKRDPRITRVGAFLRSTSLDELPQLINVVKGEMSLVGPRPLPTRDVQRFSEPWLMRRFSVKPGITGLWQVTGRSNTDFDAAIQLDLKYIDRWTPLLDLSILARTLTAVVRRSGAY